MLHFNNSRIFINDLKLCILPGKIQSTSLSCAIYNKTYLHWKQIWSQVLNLENDLHSDTFLRQDLICPIIYKNEQIIGLICCTFFDGKVDAYLDQSYLSGFKNKISSDEFAREFMSIEYLSVDEQYRKTKIGFSLGDVLLGLSMKVFLQSSAQFVLGTARSVIKVDRNCFDFGFSNLGEIQKYGHPCTLIYNSRTTCRENSSPILNEIISYLWQNRDDRTYIPKLNNNNKTA